MSMAHKNIPRRAETLKVLGLMGTQTPILQMRGSDDGFGDRFTLHGGMIEPAIADWLLKAGYIADAGATQFGARRLQLTATGQEFRSEGQRWWRELGLLAKLRVILFG